MATRPPARRPHLKNSPFRAPEPVEQTNYSANDRVAHDRHGLGSVVRLDGDRVVVRFRDQMVSVPRSTTKMHLL
ncbi:MAG TPA: hypothetical protein VGK60_03900 [Pedococcus sp.]|jgi:hypothetical protein